MSKITQFIVVIVFASCFVIVGVVLLGRNTQRAIRDTLAQGFMQQQITVIRQFSTSLESILLDVNATLIGISQLEEVKGKNDACTRELKDTLKRGNGSIIILARIGTSNVIDCSSEDQLIDTDARILIPNITKYSSSDSFVGHLSMWKGKEVLSVVLPMIKKDKIPHGFIAAFFYLADIEKRYLSSLQALDKGSSLFIDDNGVILFASNSSYKYLIGKNISINGLDQTSLFQSQGFQRTYKRALLGYSGTSRYTINREDTLFIYDVVSVLPNHKWAVVMFVPRDEVDSVVNTLIASHQRTFLTLLVGTILFLSTLIITVFVFQIARPITELKRAALDISEGKLDVEINSSSNDEIGQLAATLKQMEGKLRISYTQLEDKVRQRTDQLAERIQQLSRERAKDDAVIQSIGEGLAVTGQDGNIIVINEEAQRLLKVSKNEVIGKMFTQIVQVQDERGSEIPTDSYPIFMALTTGRKLSTTLYYVRSDKTKFLAAVNVSPIIIEGEIIGAVQIFRDITKEKEIDRMKTEFISLASHQLRTPLSAMKWFLEMLIAGDAGELNHEQRYFIENVDRSNERMIQLVNALLNVSRIESGRIIIDPKPTDLGKLFDEVLAEHVNKIEAKKIQLSVSVHPQLPIVNVDPKLIREVYSNLLSNSIKYTANGGEVSVFISKRGDNILFQITDTGYGIPRKEQRRVFQKFYRGENIIPVESEGSGLGLYLTKAVVESSSGQIWFESEEGKGTTFWFSLPLLGSKPKEGEVTLDS